MSTTLEPESEQATSRRVSDMFEDPTAEPKQKRVSVMKKSCHYSDSTDFKLNEKSDYKSKRKSYVDGAKANRMMKFSTRLNASYKWKTDMSVIGALEVPSEPHLDFRAELTTKPSVGKETQFDDCLAVWDELKLRKSFIEACEGVPPSMSCCGLVRDHNRHVRDLAGILNSGWAKAVNKRMKPRGYKISVFVWNWTNASGPGETSVMLIRFHEFRKAKRASSIMEESSSTLELSQDRPNSAGSFGYCTSFQLRGQSPIDEGEGGTYKETDSADDETKDDGDEAPKVENEAATN